MPRRMSTIVEAVPQLIASATLHVDTPGVGFVEITENAVSFVKQAGAGEGILLIYLRHTGKCRSRRASGLGCCARPARA
jgi:hypothetical protein